MQLLEKKDGKKGALTAFAEVLHKPSGKYWGRSEYANVPRMTEPSRKKRNEPNDHSTWER